MIFIFSLLYSARCESSLFRITENPATTGVALNGLSNSWYIAQSSLEKGKTIALNRYPTFILQLPVST